MPGRILDGAPPELPVLIVDDAPLPDKITNPFNEPLDTLKVGQSFAYGNTDRDRIKSAIKRINGRSGKKFSMRMITRQVSRVWRIK